MKLFDMKIYMKPISMNAITVRCDYKSTITCGKDLVNFIWFQ